MKPTLKLLLVTAAVMAAAMPANGQQTKILTADKHNEYGLVYTLPLTAFEVEVAATHEVRRAGPYYQYARKSTGTSNVVTEDADIWTIETVRVRPFGQPDPSARYLMQLKPGATSFIGVDADGMLLSINKTPKEGKAWESLEPKAPEGEVIADKEYLQYAGEDFLASQSMAKQAQLLGESLMEIRDAKLSLTRGTADQMPTDGKQLELMLNSLRHQEAAIAAAFIGTVTKETVVRKFVYVPEGEGREILFRMSDFAGFVDASDYSGEPVWIDVAKTAEAVMPTDAKGEAKKLPKDAVAYKVPGTGTVTIDFEDKKLYSGEFEISQFGLVFGLNPLLFSDKKTPSYAVFNSATGALEEIGILDTTK